MTKTVIEYVWALLASSNRVFFWIIFITDHYTFKFSLLQCLIDKMKRTQQGFMAATDHKPKISSFLLFFFFFSFLFCNHGKTIDVNFPWTFLFKGLGPHWPSRASWNLILSTRRLLKQSGSTTTIYVPECHFATKSRQKHAISSKECLSIVSEISSIVWKCIKHSQN